MLAELQRGPVNALAESGPRRDGVDLRRLRVALPLAGILAGVLMLGLAGCSDTRPCAGQCGPPFQLTVFFRHGTSPQAGRAALQACAADNPQVERVGPVQLRPRPGGGKPEPQATVYTRSLHGGGAASRRLMACLKGTSAVLGAVYFD